MATAGRRTQKRANVPRKKRTVPRKPARRAIPGTVFPIHRVLRVSNQRLLDAMGRLHRGGRLNLVWRLSPKQKERLNAKKREDLWFVPTRLPSTPTAGPHGRSLFARIGNRYVFLKGSGAREQDTSTIRFLEDPRTGEKLKVYGFGFEFDRIAWPFSHRPREDFHTRQLWGGSQAAVNMEVMNVAETLHHVFRDMLRPKKTGQKPDPVVVNAWRKGIRAFPTLEPIALFRLLQIPVKYTAGHGNTKRTDTHIDEELAGRREEERMREEFRSRLTPAERKVFDRRYKRAKQRAKETSEPQKLVMKVADGKRHLDIPEEVLEQQAVLAYAVKSQFRLSEMGSFQHEIGFMADPLFAPHGRKFFNIEAGKERISTIGDRRLKERAGRYCKAWRELFRLNGFKLEFDPEIRSFHGGRFRITRTKNRREVTKEAAREIIANQLARTLGTGLYIMHEGLNGSFSQKHGEGFISSLDISNVSICGEILDLDTAHFGKGNELKKAQAHDIELAKDHIRALAGMLAFRGEKVPWHECYSRAIERFEVIVSGKPA